MIWKGFRWEQDNFWWEMIRLDELGLPSSWNFIVPDKLTHCLSVFLLAWLFSKWMNRHIACLLSLFLWVVPWEFVLDGCFRYGASWKDMVANTIGALLCWWWLGNKKVGQTND